MTCRVRTLANGRTGADRNAVAPPTIELVLMINFQRLKIFQLCVCYLLKNYPKGCIKKTHRCMTTHIFFGIPGVKIKFIHDTLTEMAMSAKIRHKN